MKPGDEVRLVKENLAFAVALWNGAASGRLPPRSLVRPPNEVPLFNQQPASAPRSESELATELTRGAANQMRAAFALSALQAQRSLAAAFPGDPIREEWPELRAALSCMYLIGLAVQRSIVQPVWECPPPYRRQFHIHRLGFSLNATGLEGRVLSWDDFGGLDRYLGLLDYCARSADAAVASGSGTNSRTLPTGRASARSGYGGVIGSPGTDSDDGGPPLVVKRPQGYNEDTPERRLAPDAPPLLPPRVPVPSDDDVDSWDSAIREHADRWHATPRPNGSSQPANGAGQANGRRVGPRDGPLLGNLIGRFVAERCETGDGCRILAGELYAGFLGWCDYSGSQPISQRAFGMRLTGLGLRRKRRGHGKHWWEGIRLAG